MSPEWYKTIERHVLMDSQNTRQHSKHIPDGFYHIASLWTGEVVMFTPSMQLMGEDGAVIDAKHHTFRMMMRKRVTWDGGKTVVYIH